MKYPSVLGLLLIGLALCIAPLVAQHHAYKIEDVSMPKNVAPEVGGLTFDQDGNLIVVTRRHGIWIGTPSEDPTAFDWRPFATTSLHNPMGVLTLGPGDLLVPQMAELTRIRDIDGDGLADSYTKVSTGWGVSGNYHETNAGPIPDGSGNWFVAVGTASHNGPTFAKVRGRFSRIGRRGRNFSAVDWKGWVLKVKPDGSIEPWASGFRANNGIAMSPSNALFVTDNQGDWRGTSPIYHVLKGGFYGHPSSLVWRADHPGDDPLNYPIEQLESMRTRAAVELPHGDVCNSPSEPIFDTTGGAFGPFTSQMFVGDIAGPRIVRVMLETVNGVYQGACIPFAEGGMMRGGTNRLCFSPDGKTLYAGQTYRGWGKPSEGLQRITFTGHVPFEIAQVTLRPDGYRLTFTTAIDKTLLKTTAMVDCAHFYYDYGRRYGSPKRGLQKVEVKNLRASADGKSVDVVLIESVERHRIYRLTVKGLHSAMGMPLVHSTLHYTVNELRSELTPLLHGQDLSGWTKPKYPESWTVKDGVLTVTNNKGRKGENLNTLKSYRDFVCQVEFKFGKGTVDSGIFIRNNKEQIQIGISGSLKRDMTASPYIPGKGYPVEATGIAKLLRVDGWNTLRVRALGKTYTTWLNGTRVMNYTSETAIEEGPLGIQLHAGREMTIYYRNIEVSEIASEQAAEGK